MNGVPPDLAEGQCREFGLQDATGTVACFVVQWRGKRYAYRNSCPHTGAPLNWQPDNFLNFEGDLIECALHGALFRIEDGLCLRGPCVGLRLEPVAAAPGGHTGDSGAHYTYDD